MKSIRAVLIELGNTGIEGCLKPSDYYNKKIDVALKDLSEIVLAMPRTPYDTEALQKVREATIEEISNIILGG